MRAVIQRAEESSVKVNGKTVGSAGRGYMILLGVKKGDGDEEARLLARKTAALRVFEDENGKSNLSVQDIHGDLLIISQFTLYADCRKGNRPSYTNAGNPDLANELYEYIIAQCQREFPNVQHGVFGAHMKVSLLNDGPFTIIFDSDQMC